MTSNRRRINGVVTRAKSEKTVIVTVKSSSRHPLYGKVMHSRKNYMVHDELGCRLGDQVRMVESRPISKNKHWVIEEVLQRQSELEIKAAGVEAEEPMIALASEVEEPMAEVEAEE
ncbi:MAG: 30S ribosomal protein S17 [Anaerolineales bacterium]|nr:MAG: 30S ribosomal protein S17 [Anaerolineales bacterium]